MKHKTKDMRQKKQKKDLSFCSGVPCPVPHAPCSMSGASCYMLHASCPRGFTLLFAVLLGSLLFALGMSVSRIALKEVLLSSSGKGSSAAFYAADAGVECALYWDIAVGGIFSAPDGSGGDRTEIVCNGMRISLEPPKSFGGDIMTGFEINMSPACADVSVWKKGGGDTTIESRGRNDCGGGNNPNRVERALRVIY